MIVIQHSQDMKIPLFKIYWDSRDIKAVERVISRGRDWAVGPNVQKLERELAEYLGMKYSLVFNSGTSALHALMLALDIGPGDEVIVPSFTFIATANAPLFVGAKPVFAEIEEETLGLDPADTERKISKKTKAIMPIHYAGCPCKIRELKEIAKKYNLILIEDAAEALGAKIGDEMVGTFGRAAVFSFCGPKIVTTGEGGAVLTNSKKIYERQKLIRSHGRQEKENYFSSCQSPNYIRLGYNFRMSNILAALGLSQLQKIDKIIKMRQSNAHYLTNKLSEISAIFLPKNSQDLEHIYQMYTIRIKKGRKARDSLKDYLNKKGIAAKVYFPPVHLSLFYKKTFGYKKGDLPRTEKISDEVLTLPMSPGLTKKEMDYLAKQINMFFKKYVRGI